MSEEKKTSQKGISRRDFLKDAGIVVGGTAVGSTFLLSACSGGDSTTKTVTTTIAGETVTKYACPFGNVEFGSLTQLKNHIETEHLDAEAASNFVTLKVNGDTYGIITEPHWTLAYVIREKLGLTATKWGCDRGDYGHCTVLVDGTPVYSCLLLVDDVIGKEITTLEGISDGINYDPIQQEFYDRNAFQCGWCTSGFILAAKALKAKNPNPSLEEVKEALSGHVCVCGGMRKVVEAVAEGGS
jgi:aerobic-type carbon monoxide dehydrogenase small subunit (CoxS/CutS family)